MDKKNIKQPPKGLIKYGLIALAVMIVISAIASVANPESDTNTNNASNDSQSQQEAKSAYQQAYDDSGLRDEASSVSFNTDTGVMTAQYEQGDKLDGADMVRSALSDYIKLGLKAFELEDVQELELTVMGDFTDSQGNPTKDIITRVSMSKDKFTAQNWSDLEYQPILEIVQGNATNMIIDPSVIDFTSDDIFYAP